MQNYLDLLDMRPSNLLSKSELLAALSDNRAGYYVYCLWRTDLGEPAPFYVGKGTGRRVTVHLCPSTFDESPIKGRILRKLCMAGQDVMFSIFQFGMTESEAHTLECQMISLLGRQNLATGPLSNMTDGGEGMSGHLGLKLEKHPKARPVIVNDILYSCASEAVQKTGLGLGQISHRIRHGWPGFRYADENQRPCRKGRKGGLDHPRAREVIADGKHYRMLSEAAEALKVYPSAIHKRIAAGWPGYFYEGDCQKDRSRPKKHSAEHIAKMRLNTNNKRRRVKIDGVEYRSLSDAGAQLGYCYVTIRNRCKSEKHLDYCFID